MQPDPASLRGHGTAHLRLIAVATALAALAFLVLPATQYLGNLPEFTSSAAALARLQVLPVLVTAGLVAAWLRIAPPRVPTRAVALLSAAVLLAWAQAFLVVWDYGPLDGSTIDWSANRWRGLDVVAWVAGLALAARFHRPLEGPLVAAALTVVTLQSAAIVAQGLAQREALALKSSAYRQADHTAALARFSPERNVVHLVLDSFQSDVLGDIVTGPGGDAVQAALPGFTFFEEHAGTFPATHLALPVIISGQVYRNHVPLPEFMAEAFGRGSILRAARNAGFEVDVAADSWAVDLLAQSPIDHAHSLSRVAVAEEALRLLDLALFRMAPHLLKRAVHNDQRWLLQAWAAPSDLARFAYFTHNAFLLDLTRRLATDRERPVYKYLHLQTTHRPFVVHPDCSYTGGVVARVRETVTAQSRCSLAYVVGLFNRMKQAGIYDSSLIILMADHGGHIAPHRYRPGKIRGRGLEAELRPHEVAMATPVLAIKPPGAAGPFRISTGLTSMSDVPATVDHLMGLGGTMPGASIFAEGASRPTRLYYYYVWSPADRVRDYVERIEEFEISGSIYDAGSWFPARTLLAPEASR